MDITFNGGEVEDDVSEIESLLDDSQDTDEETKS